MKVAANYVPNIVGPGNSQSGQWWNWYTQTIDKHTILYDNTCEVVQTGKGKRFKISRLTALRVRVPHLAPITWRYIVKVYGPYLRKDNRLHLVIYKDGKVTSMSYPKFLMEQHLGRSLLSDETVDHIDGNPINNELSNLQLLSRAENARKSAPRANMLNLTCKKCGKSFTRRAAVHNYNTNVRKVDGPFCSQRCVGKVHN